MAARQNQRSENGQGKFLVQEEREGRLVLYRYRKAMCGPEPGGDGWKVFTELVKYLDGGVDYRIIQPRLPKSEAKAVTKALNLSLGG